MVNIESVKKFNSRLNEHKGKINNLRVRIEMQEAEIERRLGELSTMLGMTVTVDNVEQLHQSLSADIENQLENGNAILDRIEERASGNNMHTQNPAVGTAFGGVNTGVGAYGMGGTFAQQNNYPAFGGVGMQQTPTNPNPSGTMQTPQVTIPMQVQTQVQSQVQPQVQPQVQQMPAGVFGAFGGMGGFSNVGAAQQLMNNSPLQGNGGMSGFGVITSNNPADNAANGVIGV